MTKCRLNQQQKSLNECQIKSTELQINMKARLLLSPFLSLDSFFIHRFCFEDFSLTHRGEVALTSQTPQSLLGLKFQP